MQPIDDDVKAGYLLKFDQFVRYPQDLPPNNFDICLLDQESIGHVLETQLLDQRLQNRPVHIRHYDKAADARACAIIFMGASEVARLDKYLAELEASNALTVSDVRFAVNLTSATRAGLTLSSELLKVAAYVTRIPSQEVQ